MIPVLFRIYLALQGRAREAGWMRHRRLRKLSRSLYKRLHGGSRMRVRCVGHTWWLDPADIYFSPSLVVEGTHESADRAQFGALIRPGMTVVDLGAHVGWYTVLAAERVGAAGRVIACEPDPQNRALLEENLRVNGYEHVTVLPVAISAGPGRVTLWHREAGNTGGHTLAGQFPGAETVTVEAATLDAVLAGESRPIDVIKLDIEGAELWAWRGMRETLARNPQVRIMMEICPSALEYAGVSVDELLAACDRDGFASFRLRGAPGRLVPTTSDELVRLCAQGEGHTNIFLERIGSAKPAHEMRTTPMAAAVAERDDA